MADQSPSQIDPALPPMAWDDEPPKRSHRGWWVFGGVVAALILAELVLEFARPWSATLQVVNKGAMPVENLRAICNGREVKIGTIAPGSSAGISLTSPKKSTLLLKFSQKGNPLSAIEIEEYDTSALRSEGQKLVITLQEAGYERYPVEDLSSPGRKMLKDLNDGLSEILWGK